MYGTYFFYVILQIIIYQLIKKGEKTCITGKTKTRNHGTIGHVSFLYMMIQNSVFGFT
jgi:hypothetical protein